MLELLLQEKDKLITAKKALPSSIILPTDEHCSAWQKIEIGEEVRQDINHLNSFFSFLQENQNKSIIANIGMVNAGKSALFNHLAHQGESGIFQEAPIRETAKVQQTQLDKNTILMDLPGLDSVLSAADDRIVKENIRKANLLLVVIGVNQPIPKHLYNFLQSNEVIKTHQAQRIIIVLNKIDIWDGLPELHRKRQVESYINFLKNGHPDLNFPGINHLFDYDIPIIPFSVFHARYQNNRTQENYLRHTIANTLSESSSSYLTRAEQELMQCGLKYIYLIVFYHVMQEKIKKIYEKVNLLASRLVDNLSQIISNESSSLLMSLSNLKSGCFDDMSRCQPDSAESFWKGTYYLQKKERLSSYRSQYQSKMGNVFDNFSSSLRTNMSNLIKGTFGECSYISVPDKTQVYDSLNALISKIWDVHDDVYFLEYSTSGYRVTEKLDAINNSLGELIISEINKWKDSLLDQINTAFQEAKNSYFKKQAGEYLDACNALNRFYEIFTETETFKQIVLMAESSN